MVARALSSSRCGRICRRMRRCWREIFPRQRRGTDVEDYSDAQQRGLGSLRPTTRTLREAARRAADAVATHRGRAGRLRLARRQRPRSICSTCIRRQPGRVSATMLSMRWKSLPRARGAAKLTVDASDTARGFFESRGFTPQQRNTVCVGDEWLGNTTMTKKLSQREAP